MNAGRNEKSKNRFVVVVFFLRPGHLRPTSRPPTRKEDPTSHQTPDRGIPSFERKIAHVADVVLSLARPRVVRVLLAFALVLLAFALAILAWKV